MKFQLLIEPRSAAWQASARTVRLSHSDNKITIMHTLHNLFNPVLSDPVNIFVIMYLMNYIVTKHQGGFEPWTFERCSAWIRMDALAQLGTTAECGLWHWWKKPNEKELKHWILWPIFLLMTLLHFIHHFHYHFRTALSSPLKCVFLTLNHLKPEIEFWV